MSQFKAELVESFTAAGAITAHRFVTHAGAQAGADANTAGVALADASGAGVMVTVVTLGTAIVESGAAVSAGATVKSNASGQAITWATSGAKVGVARTAATGAGQLIEIFLVPNAA